MAKMTVSSVSQKSEEIAELIKEILLSSKPHFRYITNKKVSVAEMKAKLADPTGDKLQDVIDEQNFFGTKSEWKKKWLVLAPYHWTREWKLWFCARSTELT